MPTQEIKKGEFPVVYSNGILRHHKHYKCEAPGLITGRSGTIGKFTFVENGKYWPHNTSLWVTDFCGNHPQYMYYLFQTINIEQYATGSGVPTLNRNDVHRHIVFVPSVDEQKKIAEFLSIVDERIATQIGAIEKIESLISCLYDKLFQTETGETKPLKEICQIRKGEQVNSDQLSEKGEYYVMNGGITPSGYWNKFNTESRTISISEGGNSCGYVQYNKHRFWSGGHCYTLHPDNERVLTKYLFHYLKYRQQDIMALRIGSGLPNIQKKDLENYRILITPFAKQMHIVEILDGFYCKLNIEEQLLEQYKLQKQYLLSQMFV